MSRKCVAEAVKKNCFATEVYMSRPATVSLIALILAAGIGLGWAAFGRTDGPKDDDNRQQGNLNSEPESNYATLTRRIEQLESKLEKEVFALTKILHLPSNDNHETPSNVSQSSVGREADYSGDITALRQRIDSLELYVAILKNAVEKQLDESSLKIPDYLPPGATADQIKEALRWLGIPNPNEKSPLRRERIALRERLLNEFPNDPSSAITLSAILSDLLYDKRPAEAERILQRYRTLPGIPEWDFSLMSVSIARNRGNVEEERRLYSDIINSSAPSGKKANAQFQLAYSMYQLQDYVQAEASFSEIIKKYGGTNSPDVQGIVTGAKEHLKLIEKAKTKSK